MNRLILSPNPFSVANSVSERNTVCISDRAEFATGKGDAEEFGGFMNNPG